MEDFFCSMSWGLVITSIIALTAISVSIYSLKLQRKHNKLTFKPIPVIVKYNYVNVIRVRLWNKGNGPLIIKSFIAQKDNEQKNSLIELMPEFTRKLAYVEFIDDLENRAISSNDSLNLLEFKIRKDNKGKKKDIYEDAFNHIKEKLNGTIIKIEFTDIYNEIQKPNHVSKPLDFGITDDEEYSTHNTQ